MASSLGIGKVLNKAKRRKSIVKSLGALLRRLRSSSRFPIKQLQSHDLLGLTSLRYFAVACWILRLYLGLVGKSTTNVGGENFSMGIEQFFLISSLDNINCKFPTNSKISACITSFSHLIHSFLQKEDVIIITSPVMLNLIQFSREIYL